MSDNDTAVAELQGLLRKTADECFIEGFTTIPDEVVSEWTEEERGQVAEFCTSSDELINAPKCLWKYMGIEEDDSEFSNDPSAILDEPPAPGDPADVDRQNAEWIKALRDAEQTCKNAERDYLEAKEQASEAKKYLDGKIAELRRMIDRGPDRQAKLPLAGDQAEPASEPTESTVAPVPAEPEPWRSWPIHEIDGLKPGHIKSLAEAGIETMGQLTDHVAKHGDFWAKEIAGIGPKAAEVISESLDEFWKIKPWEQADDSATAPESEAAE